MTSCNFRLYVTNNPAQGSFESCLNFPQNNEEGYKKELLLQDPPPLPRTIWWHPWTDRWNFWRKSTTGIEICVWVDKRQNSRQVCRLYSKVDCPKDSCQPPLHLQHSISERQECGIVILFLFAQVRFSESFVITKDSSSSPPFPRPPAPPTQGESKSVSRLKARAYLSKHTRCTCSSVSF